MLKQLTPRRIIVIIFSVMLLTLCGAWLFELMGYVPCDLCYKQRWAYYCVIPFCGLLYLAAPYLPQLVRPGLWLLCLILAGSAVFGAYHAGVEWKWWQGPTSCGGTGLAAGVLPDLTKKIVLCDEAALRILGLSLAGWNSVISFLLALLAAFGAIKARSYYGSSSVSQ